MRHETINLKKKLQFICDQDEKIELLKNTYNCEECYIITAGPSFNEINPSSLKKKLKDKLVISVKQTFNILDDITDIHLINPYNYQPYRYSLAEPIIIYTEISNLNFKTPQLKYDFKFTIPLEKANKENSLAKQRNFEDYLIDKSKFRPFGPGIMHEIGIYLPILLGIKKVYVIGWDLGYIDSNKIDRFYSNKKRKNIIINFVINKSPKFYNNFFVPIINKYNYLLFLFGYNKVLNNPGISDKEASFISESTWDLYNWYKSKNIDLYIISNKSMVDQKIPRKEFQLI